MHWSPYCLRSTSGRAREFRTAIRSSPPTSEWSPLLLERGPRIAITPSAIVISAIAGTKPPSGSDGDLKTWRSTDGGKTWTEGGRINDVIGAAREGLHTMTSGPGGMLFAAW